MSTFQIKYYNKLTSIEPDWRILYNKSSLTYFCSAEWHKVVLSFLKKSALTKRLLKIQYFSVQNEKNQVIVAGFFFVNRYGKNKKLQFSHILGPSDYYDFVYQQDDLTFAAVKDIMSTIQKKYNAASLSVSMVKESSSIASYLLQNDKALKTQLPAAAIHLEENYEQYLQALSKSVKQNIRTAYNRLKRDELDYKLTIVDRNDTANIDFNKLKELYALRNVHRKEEHNWKVKLFQSLNNSFSAQVDMFELETLKQTDFTLGLLEFKNELAAYFFGFERNGKIEINRVVINEAFKFYSPGMILFNEYIKIAFEQDIKVIDLTNGDEKYKFDLGGKIHNVYNATMV